MGASDNLEVLEAIGRVDEKLDAKIRDDEARFKRLEDDVTDVRERLAARAKQDGDFADAIGKCASAAARASEIAYQAQRTASDVRDEATKIVQSALQIHNASIAVSVNEAVKGAVKPLATQVEAIEKNDKAQSDELAEIKGLVQTIAGVVVKAATHKWLRRALIVAAIVGALIGGGVAGYLVAHGTIEAKKAVGQ